MWSEREPKPVLTYHGDRSRRAQSYANVRRTRLEAQTQEVLPSWRKRHVRRKYRIQTYTSISWGKCIRFKGARYELTSHISIKLEGNPSVSKELLMCCLCAFSHTGRMQSAVHRRIWAPQWLTLDRLKGTPCNHEGIKAEIIIRHIFLYHEENPSASKEITD